MQLYLCELLHLYQLQTTHVIQDILFRSSGCWSRCSCHGCSRLVTPLKPIQRKPSTARIEGKNSTAKYTSIAAKHCSSRGTAVRSKVAAELGQGRNRRAEGQGRSHRKPTASPCRTPELKTCAIDALMPQTHLHCTHVQTQRRQ